MAVLASGRGTNFKAIVESSRQALCPYEVVCLITDKLDAGAVRVAEASGILWHHVDAGGRRGRLREGAEEEIVALCEGCRADLVFLGGFMRILRGALLARYPGRIFNVHPSLLPSFKGLDAPRQALEYGVRVSGCTVHLVDDSVDGGPIIVQSAVDVRDDDTVESLRSRIHAAEHESVVRAATLLASGQLRFSGRRMVGTSNDEERPEYS